MTSFYNPALGILIFVAWDLLILGILNVNAFRKQRITCFMLILDLEWYMNNISNFSTSLVLFLQRYPLSSAFPFLISFLIKWAFALNDWIYFKMLFYLFCHVVWVSLHPIPLLLALNWNFASHLLLTCMCRLCLKGFWLIYHLLHFSWANWNKSKTQGVSCSTLGSWSI